jgi:hypothetical protein
MRERSGRIRRQVALVLLGAGVVGCSADFGTGVPAGPAPPRNFDAWYYAQAVHLSWELDSRWNGEPFRIYGRRITDNAYFLVAEVSNCSAGACSYRDVNVAAGVVYEYYVASVDPDTGEEAASEFSIEVEVPHPVPPPVPGDLDAVPLDDAVYLRWNDASRSASDFAFYRIYLEGGDGSVLLLGETDSEGFLDLLVQNGNTYGYFVTAVDDLGHESEGSALAEGTPRPDYSGEVLFAWEDVPAQSGFRFQESELDNPIRHGGSPERHFRLEVDGDGWWLVPGPDVEVHRDAFIVSQLRCGPAADAGCTDIRMAPSSNYSADDIALQAGFAYVIRVPGPTGGWNYGAIRVTHVGWAQDGAVAIFDWAFQLQEDNRALMPVEHQGS